MYTNSRNNYENVLFGDELRDRIDYVDSDSRFALIGQSRTGQNIVIPIGERTLSRHMLLLGGIGTGKSNAFNHLIRSVRQSINENDVIIIFDTKGDYYDEFYRPGDIVISNDDRATGPNGADYWNIFNEISGDDRVEENVSEIAKCLFAESISNSSQPFFPNAAKDLFAALMLHMVRTDKLSNRRNNKSLRAYFNMMTPELMMNVLSQHSDLAAMQSYIYDVKSGQTLGVMAELQQLVREIFIGNFKREGSLSMRDLVRKKGGQTIFIEYDLSIGRVLTPVYKILMDMAIKEALSRKGNEGNVFFFIDEFRLLPNLEHIDDGVNFGRSLGAKFFVGIQNVDQIYSEYGEHEGKSLLSGFGTNIAFRVNDYESREYIKNIYGKNIKKQTFLSSIQNNGITEQLREANVIEDNDINNLEIGEAIIKLVEGEPFRFKFKLYK